MSNAALWALALSILTPLLTAVIQRPTWSRTRRQVVAAAISVVVGAATAFASGDLTGQTLLVSIGIVLVGAEATYQKLWAASGVSEAVELATSPKPAPQAEDGSSQVTDVPASPERGAVTGS